MFTPPVLRPVRHSPHIVNVSSRPPTNYFSSVSYDSPQKRRRSFVLFDDTNMADVRLAYYDAERMGGRIAMWKRAPLHGPWDNLPLVGESCPYGDGAVSQEGDE